MAGGKVSPEAWAILDEMRGSIETLDPATESQKLFYDHELQRMHEWRTPGRNASCRRTRACPPSSGPCS